MPRIPPTSAKWYLYEISRTRLHEGRQKEKKMSFQILSIIGKLTFGKYFPTPAPRWGRMGALCCRRVAFLNVRVSLEVGAEGH